MKRRLKRSKNPKYHQKHQWKAISNHILNVLISSIFSTRPLQLTPKLTQQHEKFYFLTFRTVCTAWTVWFSVRFVDVNENSAISLSMKFLGLFEVIFPFEIL